MKWRLISTVLFAIVLTAVLAAQDPYAVLGISKSASLAEIKNAYRNLVKIWYASVNIGNLRGIYNYNFVTKKFLFFRHPDKSNHPEAETKFIEITTAYEVKSFLL